ncbi:MAG: Asp23/Gls24 family envelope stress response protein [Oscillospiraceae bacterium]
MQNISRKPNVGSLKISEEVLATIASFAAKEVSGVASMALSNPASIKNFLVKSSPSSKSVKIELNDDVAVIDVYVNLKYGAKIPETSEAIQTSVKESVQNMTGITVSSKYSC